MEDRVFVFIDGSNLDMATKSAFNKRVDVDKVVQKLINGRSLMRVNYYEAPLLADVNLTSFNAQQRFFEHLRMNPYFEIKLGRRVKREKEHKCPECEHVFVKITWEQKGVDTLIAFDLVALASRNAYDTAIIVAGDQDFVCPILEVRLMGKRVENAFTERACSPALKGVVDKAILLDADFLKGCWR